MPIITILVTLRVPLLDGPAVSQSCKSSRAATGTAGNFRRRQIAHQFLCAGMAKAAGQRAADLAGHT